MPSLIKLLITESTPALSHYDLTTNTSPPLKDLAIPDWGKREHQTQAAPIIFPSQITEMTP